jgi:tetraacyldisaccharide 4'-kinase
VGNLTLGGTGKTPAVQWLARALQAELPPGAKIGVVARGYRGSARDVAVVSDGEHILLDARVAGDEPLLHARALPGTVVTIGRDRAAAAKKAIELGAKLLILDDAFSYWSIARDFDLVLLDARRPFDNGHLLPRGRLREEAEQLKRASAILLTRSDLASAQELDGAERAVRSHSAALLFRAQHAPCELRAQPGNEPQPLELLRGAPIGTLSALADNDAFARSLEARGAAVVARCARRDHHAWRDSEVSAALERFASAGAAFAVTTGKDAVKLTARSWPLPLYVLEIALQVEDGERLLQAVRQALKRL